MLEYGFFDMYSPWIYKVTTTCGGYCSGATSLLMAFFLVFARPFLLSVEWFVVLFILMDDKDTPIVVGVAPALLRL